MKRKRSGAAVRSNDVEATKPSAIYNVPAAEQAQVRDMNGNQEVDDNETETQDNDIDDEEMNVSNEPV